MNLPVSWLKEFVEIEDIKEFADKMTMSGTKVETIHPKGAELSGIVVANVVAIDPHPTAPNLAIATITTGNEQLYQMVTGAKNLSVGDFVPAALPGAVLAGGVQIEQKEFKGQVSQGMLCSIDELGYTSIDYPETSENGIYVFPTPQELGSDACLALELKDHVIEFELTTDRPDCFSLAGIAREANALGYKTKKIPTKQFDKKDMIDIKVTIENPAACLRYIARVVKNVKIEPSPQWMRRRLTLSGVRPRNNIVDITNYVMLEYGQPLHAFDMDHIKDNHIIVRNATEGEQIISLDGNTHDLTKNALVIADSSKPSAIAGIIGGKNSAITDTTTNVIFESANFYGPGIRQTSKTIGLRTDASTRNEKGLDPNIALTVVNRCMDLIEQLNCGDIVDGWVDVYPNPLLPHTVKYEPSKINALLGTEIPQSEMENILASLEIESKENIAHVPTFRQDIKVAADIAEEISRIYGYDNIPFDMDSVTVIGGKNTRKIIEDLILNTTTALGLHQIMTYSFEDSKVFDKLNLPQNHALRKAVTIDNPLGENSTLKTTLVGGILNSLSLNYSRRNMSVALMELAKVFTKTPKAPKEELTLTIGLYKKNADFFYTKTITEEILQTLGIKATYTAAKQHPYMHPGRCADILFNDIYVGTIGQVHPLVCENYEIELETYIATINIEVLLPHINLTKTYTPLPKYPAITRDIAFKIKSTTTAADIENAIKENINSDILEHITLFDIYQGEQIEPGYKSMAYSLTFRHISRTLEDAQINVIVDNLVTTLKQKFGAELRGV